MENGLKSKARVSGMQNTTFHKSITAIGRLVLLALICLGLKTGVVLAAQSLPHDSISLTARLITAEDGVAPTSGRLTGGLHIDLKEDWKTYWHTPGEAGIPPKIDWSNSKNVANVEFQWPAPTRFETFGIENIGYEDEVTFPLVISLKEPGKPAFLYAQVSLLVCSTICIPETFNLSLPLSDKTSIDRGSAEFISRSANKVPTPAADPINYYLNKTTNELSITLPHTLGAVDDILPIFGISTFEHPEITTGATGQLSANFKIGYLDQEATEFGVTVLHGENGTVFRGERTLTSPTQTGQAMMPLIWVIGLALLGGLILNVMPCVLPVLTIKIASTLSCGDQPASVVRTRFLATAAGVVAFMWILAAFVLSMQAMGKHVGWGMHFQNPYFLALLAGIIILFAGNLLGAFEINLPSKWNTAASDSSSQTGLTGDFLTGVFMAVLATPCSAPFLGTAVSFALSGGPIDVVAIFTALGLGLAAPYFMIATWPKIISFLPKPGSWMVWVKLVLGVLLALTALWLLTVLATVSGTAVALATFGFALLALCLLAFARFVVSARWPLTGATFALLMAVLAPLVAVKSTNETFSKTNSGIAWDSFEMEKISTAVDAGQTVFVDVTADWCLTCKANKRFVLTKETVQSALLQDDVVPLVADWTRPNDMIANYLNANGRYGIPFNIVYGPNAPDGIALPELLTQSAVIDALTQASGK